MQRMAGNHFFCVHPFKIFAAKQAGISLLEILMSLLLLSLGLLALIRLQLLALQQTDHALLQSIAVTQLQSMADKLAIQAIDPVASLMQWNIENARLLPAGKGGVNESEIYIMWTDTLSKKSVKISTKTLIM
jgi:Tfp pilus assembly protein PilV